MLNSFRLKTFCCCCFNLKTGSLVIGTLGWLITLFQLFYLTSPLRLRSQRYRDTEVDIAAEISYSAVSLLVCVLMIVGVYKNNHKLILPWLVFKCIDCIAWSIITILILVLFFFVDLIIQTIFLFFIIFFAATLNWYFWICVWSLYMDLKTEEDIPGQTVPLKETKTKEKDECPIEAV